MRLNLPILDALAPCQNILIVGIGGGFDLYCGLPIYVELCSRGQTVHLANLSFSTVSLSLLKNPIHLTKSLVGVTAEVPRVVVYFPELYLAQWFKETQGEEVTVWCLENRGVQPLLADYRALVESLSIDGILLIDGGVDSLMRGDEAEMGTVLEDFASLAAVQQLEDVPVRIVGCIGFGAEREVTHAHVLENIADLTQRGAFLGSCSLAAQMESFSAYESAVTYAHSKRLQDPSVINASIVSAATGHYGNYHLTEKTRGSRLWISPLMSIYWFFDLPGVAEANPYLPYLLHTRSSGEAMRRLWDCRSGAAIRPASRIPL